MKATRFRLTVNNGYIVGMIWMLLNVYSFWDGMTHLLLLLPVWPVISNTRLSVWPPRLCSSPSVQAVNGVQPGRHENGLSNKGDLIHLANHDNTTNGARDKSESMASEPILPFESEDSFIKKAGPMKPQHVTGTQLRMLDQKRTKNKWN